MTAEHAATALDPTEAAGPGLPPNAPDRLGPGLGLGLGLGPRHPRAAEWLRALAHRPPVLVVVVLLAVVAVAAGAPEQVSLVRAVPIVVLALVGSRAIEVSVKRIRRDAFALTGRAPRRRDPVDVRPSAAVTPTWSWTGPAGLSVLGRAAVLAVVLALAAPTVAHAAGIGSASAPEPVLDVVAAAAVVLAVLAGMWWLLRTVPSRARAVARSAAPGVVTLLGVDLRTRRWHAVPADGGPVVLIAPFSGRRRVQAGDVVHLWRAPDRPGGRRARTALTGPFGTLWTSVGPAPAPVLSGASEPSEAPR